MTAFLDLMLDDTDVNDVPWWFFWIDDNYLIRTVVDNVYVWKYFN